MLRYKTKTRPGLVALYDIRPGNGAGPFLQPRSPLGASVKDIASAIHKGFCYMWVSDLIYGRHGKIHSHHQTNQHPVFLQAGCPSCRPTNSVKALKGTIPHSMDLLTPNSPGVFQLYLWPLIAPGYLGRWLPCLSSAL